MKMQATLTAVLLAMGATGAMAVPVTLTGTHIDVVYDTADLGLFGIPSLVGDMLSWTPTAFTATRNGGPQILTSQTSVKIIAHSGFDVQSVSYSEGGSYTKVGTGLVSATGAVDVAAQAPAAPVVHAAFTTGALAAATNGSWAASVAPISFGAGTSVVSFLVSNTLKALGTANSLNTISKTLPTLSVVVVPSVPEPETYAMMLAGVAALAFVARRRKAA
jgi:hypothetical protein